MDSYFYGYGPMGYTATLEEVAERRYLNEWGVSVDPRDFDVLLGVQDCAALGQEGWLIAGGNIYSALVVDCEGQNHRGEMDQHGLFADISQSALSHRCGYLILQ